MIKTKTKIAAEGIITNELNVDRCQGRPWCTGTAILLLLLLLLNSPVLIGPLLLNYIKWRRPDLQCADLDLFRESWLTRVALSSPLLSYLVLCQMRFLFYLEHDDEKYSKTLPIKFHRQPQHRLQYRAERIIKTRGESRGCDWQVKEEIIRRE